jgi:hypothetical protein
MEKITFEYVIQVLKKRPLMVVQDYNIFYLLYLLRGLVNSRDEDELSKKELNFKRYFDEWVHSYFKDKTTHSWADLIWYHSADNREAIDKFNNLYHEFEIIMSQT